MELITSKSPGSPEIVILQDDSALTTSIGWFVRAGSRDETNELSGVSHFLEHMVFKGTDRRSAEDINRELDYLGAQSNAFTSEESTVYYASVLPEYQQQCLDLLNDLMQPAFNEPEFDTEKQVILEEIAMYDDQPPYGAFEIAMEGFFAAHPLSSRVLGTTESVSDLTHDQMRDYHRSRYTVDNMILVASGRVNTDQLIEATVRAADGWPLSATARKLIKPKPQTGSITLHREATHQHYRIIAWPGLDCNDPMRYALRMLCTILADDSGSRLFWKLIDTGRAETATIWPHQFEECGCLLGYLCCAPEDADENMDILSMTIQQILQDGVTDRELELARNKIVSGLVLSDERPSNRLFAVGQSWMIRRQYEPLDVILGRYASVTRDDILQIAQKTLSQANFQVRVQEDMESQ